MPLNVTVSCQRTLRKDMATKAECASGPVVICDGDEGAKNPTDFEDVEAVSHV